MRIVTWNTWWRFGPSDERQPLLASTLRRLQPDVVLLQETWADQAAALAVATGLVVVDVVAAPFDPPVLDTVPADHPFGNAVLARADRVEAIGSIGLDSPGDAAPRSAVAARYHDGGGPVVVISTHLCHLADAGAVRQDQLDEVHRWSREVAPDVPVLLGGDLNQVPTSDEYRASVAPHWTDLWAEARGAEPGPTMTPDNPRLSSTAWMAERNPPGAPPGVRIDYLLGRQPLTDRPTGGRVAIRAIDRIGGAADGWPSDHLGLVADVELEG